MKLTLISCAVLIALAITGCQKTGISEAAAAAPDTANPAAKKVLPNDVELDPAMLANIKIEAVRAESGRNNLSGTGKVQFNDDRTVRILAPLPGQVVDFHAGVGDPIEKDQVLFSIKSREVASLVSDYLQSQRDLDLAQKTYNMNKDLFEHQAASRISFQQAENDLAKANTQVARSEEGLRVLGIDPKEAVKDGGLRSLVPVRAPMSGTLIERNLTPGQFVQADSTALLTIADLSTVWVLVDVFERDIHLVHVGQKVQVVAAAYPDRRFPATIERISDKVDADSRTLKVRLLVSNPKFLLKPEMFITSSLELSGGGAAISVPASAVFTEDGKSYVFAAINDRRFERRLIVAAPDAEGRLRVTSGLRVGDRIVTDGAMLLDYRRKQKQD
ncbi:MAG TPA: efflux RND transporter periplasmic adaptor subunit [Bryobacteraceae bacterium]|jgi:cobalt-zinc-cadmium efflux system membrane fusion protein|nr:efflux RND transporter periplasmic adaptor subunit [Bryobacteraceae bacterium]